MINNKISVSLIMIMFGGWCEVMEAAAALPENSPVTNRLQGRRHSAPVLRPVGLIRSRLLAEAAEVHKRHFGECATCFEQFKGPDMNSEQLLVYARQFLKLPNYIGFASCVHGSHFGCMSRQAQPKCPECRAPFAESDRQLVQLGQVLNAERDNAEQEDRNDHHLATALWERDVLRMQLLSSEARERDLEARQLARDIQQDKRETERLVEIMYSFTVGAVVGGVVAWYCLEPSWPTEIYPTAADRETYKNLAHFLKSYVVEMRAHTTEPLV